MQDLQVQDLYEQITDAFPYKLDPTSCIIGDMETRVSEIEEYSEEFIFEVGYLLDEKLYAGGWIELRRDTDDEALTITALFAVARNADWDNGQLLPECTGILGEYDMINAEWTLWIDQY